MSLGDWYYWVQEPEGDKYIIEESVLIDRWGYNDYDGYYFYYDFHAENSGDFLIIDSITEKEAYKESGEYILIRNRDYKIKIDNELIDFKYETDNPFVQLDIFDDEVYETILKDVSLTDNIINYNIRFLNTGTQKIKVKFWGNLGILM